VHMSWIYIYIYTYTIDVDVCESEDGDDDDDDDESFPTSCESQMTISCLFNRTMMINHRILFHPRKEFQTHTHMYIHIYIMYSWLVVWNIFYFP